MGHYKSEYETRVRHYIMYNYGTYHRQWGSLVQLIKLTTSMYSQQRMCNGLYDEIIINLHNTGQTGQACELCIFLYLAYFGKGLHEAIHTYIQNTTKFS